MPIIHQCKCDICQQVEPHVEQEVHQQINLFISRLDEQQRRWYAALEAKKLGHGGSTLVAKITGLSVETIRRGRHELDKELVDRPLKQVRKPGAGRKATEKKSQQSKPLSKK